MSRRSAAILTVGSELVEGVRIDTNTAEVARALRARGFDVAEALSCADDEVLLASHLRRLTDTYELVIATGGLGPTHDDVTREAAAAALSLALVRDRRLEEVLRPALTRHTSSRAREQVLSQADVLEGARVIDPVTGTAPGQMVSTVAGELALLPGPPAEMLPMLAEVLARYGSGRAGVRELGVAGMSESEVQLIAQDVLEAHPGVELTVLARPGDVRVLLLDEGEGEPGLSSAAMVIAERLGDHCYDANGLTLAEAVVGHGARLARTIALAESCTGGMVAAALTDVPGASACFAGAAVTYTDEAKSALLGVQADTLDAHGAVSEQTVCEMAVGALDRFGADIAVAISGIAGPDGGSESKPVGTVWFAVAETVDGPAVPATTAFLRTLAGDRAGVRIRATAIALDTLRRGLLGLETG